MIIFDLDGTLANCEHRRHFVDPRQDPNYFQAIHGEGSLSKSFYLHKETNKEWKLDWKSFYKACDKDKPILPTIELLDVFWRNEKDFQIWSGRCESVIEKTINFLCKHSPACNVLHNYKELYPLIKMRPIGDYTPDEQLKERWIDDRISDLGNQVVHDIDFVFDDRPKVIRMWRRRGIFVFNCNQTGDEF